MLSREPWEPHQGAAAGAWEQGPGDLLWWPMWWCPCPPQWSAAGVEETTITVEEPAACRPAEAVPQAPDAAGPGLQSCVAKPTRRRCKKKGKAAGSHADPQVHEYDELAGRTGSSSLGGSDGSSDSSGGDLSGAEERSSGPATVAVGGLEEERICDPCGWRGGAEPVFRGLQSLWTASSVCLSARAPGPGLCGPFGAPGTLTPMQSKKLFGFF